MRCLWRLRLSTSLLDDISDSEVLGVYCLLLFWRYSKMLHQLVCSDEVVCRRWTEWRFFDSQCCDILFMLRYWLIYCVCRVGLACERSPVTLTLTFVGLWLSPTPWPVNVMMDKLDDDQLEDIKKMSTANLLLTAGYSDEKGESFDRQICMKKWAELITRGLMIL